MKEWGKLVRKLQTKVYDWRKELNYRPGSDKVMINSTRDRNNNIK